MEYCLVENKKRRAHRRKGYADGYGRIVIIAAKYLAENVREFIKHWSWITVTVVVDGLGGIYEKRP